MHLRKPPRCATALSKKTGTLEVGFDTDPKQGIETRVKVMDMLAAQRMPALVYHLPWPGIGHFAKQGDGFRYVAEPMRLAL